MSTDDGWRNRLALMGRENLNNLDRWRADNAQRAEERAHQRRTEERERRQHEEQNAVEQLRAEVQREIAHLRTEVHQLHEIALEAVGGALGEYGDKIVDHAEKRIKEFQLATERRYGELMGRIDALISGAPSRAKDFKFTNERDADSDPIDLPNPLRRVN